MYILNIICYDQKDCSEEDGENSSENEEEDDTEEGEEEDTDEEEEMCLPGMDGKEEVSMSRPQI